MPLASGEFFYAGEGEVYVAPVGTAMPVTHSEALNGAFTGTGYIEEGGVAFTRNMDVNETRSWQSSRVTDRRMNTVDEMVTFTMQQINKVTWALNFGGGSWATAGSTHTYTVPADSFIDYRAMVLHLVDGTDITRLLIPKGMVTSSGDFTATRATASGFAVTFGIVATGSGNPWTPLSNRSEFA